MKLSIITLLLILLLCGCSTHPQNENGKFIRIDIENSANNPFNLSNLSKEVSYIKLETNDSCLINSIKAIFYIDNQIIIRDNNSILFFDNTGKFQYKVNHQGDGPEEYLRLSDFDICSKNETMHILDTRKKQILQYDMKGKFQNKKDINFWAIGMQLFNDSTSILYSGNQISQNQSYKFTIYNNIKQSVSGGFYPISQKKSNYYTVHNNTNFSKYGNEFLFYELYNDTIYTLTSTNCIPRYYLNFGASRIPNSYFEKDYKNIMEFQNEMSKNVFSYGISSLLNFHNNILLSYFHNKKKHFLYYNKNDNSNVSFHQITDQNLFNDFIIDIKKYKVNFYSYENYLFTIFDNELYIDGNSKIKDKKIQDELSAVSIDDNPIIRICKITD